MAKSCGCTVVSLSCSTHMHREWRRRRGCSLTTYTYIAYHERHTSMISPESCVRFERLTPTSLGLVFCCCDVGGACLSYDSAGRSARLRMRIGCRCCYVCDCWWVRVTHRCSVSCLQVSVHVLTHDGGMAVLCHWRGCDTVLHGGDGGTRALNMTKNKTVVRLWRTLVRCTRHRMW